MAFLKSLVWHSYWRNTISNCSNIDGSNRSGVWGWQVGRPPGPALSIKKTVVHKQEKNLWI